MLTIGEARFLGLGCAVTDEMVWDESSEDEDNFGLHLMILKLD